MYNCIHFYENISMIFDDIMSLNVEHTVVCNERKNKREDGVGTDQKESVSFYMWF